MANKKELALQKLQVPQNDSELLDELGSLVDNDPESPYQARFRTRMTIKVNHWINFDGRFPSGVAFFAIAVVGSVFVILGSGQANVSPRESVWVLMGSALVAQIIDAARKK